MKFCCLVSPDLSAVKVFVGAHNEDRPRAALRTNDMIMTIDGKEVGGMTVESFQLELELAGPELILVVSRYKCVAHDTAAQETQLLSEVDKHINDPSRLDWADIGRSNTSAFHQSNKIQETEHSNQSSPESHISVHSKPSPKYLSTAENRNQSRLESDASREHEVNHALKKPSEALSVKQVQNITDHQDDSIRGGEQESENSSVLSSVEPTDLRTVLEADEESSRNSDEFGEDGNAWCGCVCGKEHSAKGNYFWIQCEACCSWFNVYERCVGFGKKEAETMEEWTCWACEESKSLKSGEKVSVEQTRESPKQERKEMIPKKASSQKSRDKVSVEQKQERKEELPKKGRSDEATDSIESKDNSETTSPHAYKVGSLVFIREHAWSGVNNPEGIARVTGVHKDKEDGRTYDVKYVVGPSSKGVFARYVSAHSFD